MRDKITREQVEQAFASWVMAMPAPPITNGEWVLDYAPIYGGYSVVAVGERGGHYSVDIPSYRVSAREMYERLTFATASVKLFQENSKHRNVISRITKEM
jgi:hypothetical protein